jgi:hypothetical protein
MGQAVCRGKEATTTPSGEGDPSSCCHGSAPRKGADGAVHAKAQPTAMVRGHPRSAVQLPAGSRWPDRAGRPASQAASTAAAAPQCREEASRRSRGAPTANLLQHPAPREHHGRARLALVEHIPHKLLQVRVRELHPRRQRCVGRRARRVISVWSERRGVVLGSPATASQARWLNRA